MIMNYKNWFYNQYKYLYGNRDGKETFNDTKWININERYKKLLELNSNLLNKQPYDVIGNNNAMNQLIDLMVKSNYTFEDLDKSLINIYDYALCNAMGKMMVNTNAVMFHCKQNDSRYVTSNTIDGYYILDIPFNQMHFGERDEFIRQKLHKMNVNDSDYYMPIIEFISTEICKLMGFTILCTTNGFISNDCLIAINDKGFKFKINWKYSSDVEFIIYKLDTSFTLQFDVDIDDLNSSLITWDKIDKDNKIKDIIKNDKTEYTCIIHTYDKNVKSQNSIPSIGIINNFGLQLKFIQPTTIKNFNITGTKTVSIVIYALKYLFEVPHLYPAINFYDMIDQHKVYDDYGNNVTNKDNDQIYSSNENIANELEITTPPIVLDRETNNVFDTLMKCFVNCFDELPKYQKQFNSIGLSIQNIKNLNSVKISNELSIPLRKIRNDFEKYQKEYIQTSLSTSLINTTYINEFNVFMNKINDLYNHVIRILNELNPDSRKQLINQIELYTFNELYDNNYTNLFVKTIQKPFMLDKLKTLRNTRHARFDVTNTLKETRINRPISEQCFISLKYNNDYECWLFDYPEIKHFNGIENTFYINNNLDGSEIYKFFVLYTDTENPSELNVTTPTLQNVFDFDLFNKEINKHIGYIRYWTIENKLLKLSKMIVDKYDSTTCVQILSKILKNKIDADDILKFYKSDINYELSSITSLNYDDYNENDEKAPFSINFLFYTLNMMYNNEDKLQSYLFSDLINNHMSKRYVDMDIKSFLNDEITYPINYSQFSIAPIEIDDSHMSIIPIENKTHVFYGMPTTYNHFGDALIDNPYRYTFNVYDENIKYHLMIDNDINTSYFIEYDDPTQYSDIIKYHDDIQICKYMTKYLCIVYDYINNLQNDYTTPFNKIFGLKSVIDSITSLKNDINKYTSTHNVEYQHVDTESLLLTIIGESNPILININNIINNINSIININHNNRNISIISFFNSLESDIRRVYLSTGFDHYAYSRIRMLYINIKKINKTMNIYQYKEWLNDFDIELLTILDDLVSNNENFPVINDTFLSYANSFNMYKNGNETVNGAIDNLILLQHKISLLSTSIFTSHIEPIIEFIKTINEDYIFDMYTIDKVDYDTTIEFNTKPALIIVEVPYDDIHINPPTLTPLTENVKLIFKPIIEKDNDVYHVLSISKICEYVFFNGDPVNNVSVSVLDDNSDVITTSTCNISFNRVSSSSDLLSQFNQINNIQNTVIDIENHHETHTSTNDKYIVNDKFNKMNYEMLIGNHFKPLDYNSELILNPITYQQGSVDRIYISNQRINTLMNSELGKHISKHMFFKPAQIKHIEKVDDIIECVGGKYHVKQRIYLSTPYGYIFPVYVTKCDHSIQHGFIEADVDHHNSKWFEITDNTTINEYLSNDIECTIIPDNVSNFLDEYNNDYDSYSIPSINTTSNSSFDDINKYSLPGDPIFVTNNMDYTYTRLNWIFNRNINNRFIDDEHKQYHFIYIGNYMLNDVENDNIKIKMINHNLSNISNPELYPILRQEPNDHLVWDEEIIEFTRQKQTAQTQISMSIDPMIKRLYEELEKTKTQYEHDRIVDQIVHYELKRKQLLDFIDRMDYYINNPESPTYWFNVITDDAAMVYINNGRAKTTTSTYTENIRDLPYTDKLDVFLYDWEHKEWIDPSLYTITTNMVDGINFDNPDSFKTVSVLHSITITPLESFQSSKKILIYFAYNKSDIFNDISITKTTCNVRFKPLLSIDNTTEIDVYSDIKIRKHFDSNEKYVFDDYNKHDKFSIDNSLYIKRPNESNKTFGSVLRYCDMVVTNNNNTYDYTDFDLYIKIPFDDIQIDQTLNIPQYQCTINQPIDSFVVDQSIKLICIQNNELSSYDGNMSTIMFEALTSLDENDNQILTITDTTIPEITSGTYICTVLNDNMYNPIGGIISVKITNQQQHLIDDDYQWIKIPEEFNIHHELPNEFIIVPHDDITIDFYNKKLYVEFNNHYVNDYNDTMTIDNSNVYNPYEYYYDIKKEIRLPISNTRRNAISERLIVDTETNTDIKMIKSNYIGICRYSASKINENGFVDLTGYIPSPLSRERYEFWINGRCLNQSKDLHIISPTSIQLCNLTSLRNFEVIELLDDMNDSIINKVGNIYIDINGKTFSSYELALKSNSLIINQEIGYLFYNNQHQQIFDYTKDIIPNPNNFDIETDILESIIFDESTISSYNELYNIPSINNIQLYHPTSNDLGFSEINNDKIMQLYDKIWVKEEMSNILFPITHKDGYEMSYNQYLVLHIHDNEDTYIINTSGNVSKYFTLYISTKSNGNIDDKNNTIKIIPFVKVGTSIKISKSYHGMWLHSTFNTKPILIK